MNRKLKITNAEQFQILIKLLEKNPNFARGFTKGTTPVNHKQKWTQFAKELNAAGPPTRDCDGWQKVWRDLKFKTKKKVALRQAEGTSGSGKSSKQLTLSLLEESVANLVRFEDLSRPKGIYCEIVNGFGDSFLEKDDTQATIINEVAIAPPKNAKNTSRTSKKNLKNKNKSNEANLDQQHLELQTQTLQEIAKALNDVNSQLKESLRYQRKILELEEAQLKLLKRQDERQEELFKNELKLKKLKLEIKKKEYELLEVKQ